MKKVLIALGTLALLAGCAGQNPYVTPVEDRSSARSPQPVAPGPGSVLPVEENAPGVSVQPVEDVPVFRQQRSEVQSTTTYTPPSAVEAPSLPASTASQNAAVVALLDSAQQGTASGDLRSAQNQLERALRIAPRDPQVYYQLADVQRRLGQFMQAEQVALKGINVAAGQSAQLRRLWSLLALIRSEAGDSTGAREAQQEAGRY